MFFVLHIVSVIVTTALSRVGSFSGLSSNTTCSIKITSLNDQRNHEKYSKYKNLEYVFDFDSPKSLEDEDSLVVRVLYETYVCDTLEVKYLMMSNMESGISPSTKMLELIKSIHNSNFLLKKE